ncbi:MULTISPECIES: TMEM175 family protein [Halorussus]|uniref:TMEM175 family protein n=1 Tax=Halorussus TaxID=1070314 RepID=UPI0020A09C30|nr:TMEM175 family protein [Halorussus vallis]USZ77198.1 TMEM175 family protein [Halorussus vallis]
MSDDESSTDLTRLVALSDGVFAFAITLLVVNVDLPASVRPGDPVTLALLAQLWRDVFSYVVSFLVIGNYWLDHRRMFRYVRRYTPRLAWLNLFLLMSVAFLPFPTSVLSDHGGQVPVAFYATSMTITGLLVYWLWRYVARADGLLDPETDHRFVREQEVQYFLTPLVFGLSIPVALFVAADLAFVCWASLFVLAPLSQRRLRDDGREE